MASTDSKARRRLTAVNAILAQSAAIFTAIGGSQSRKFVPHSTATATMQRQNKDDWEMQELLALEGTATDLMAIAAGVASLGGDNAVLIAGKAAAEASRDALIDGVLAQSEAAAIATIDDIDDVAALNLMTTAETAGSNRANVLAAITAQIGVLEA